jgi:hypothetical protein
LQRDVLRSISFASQIIHVFAYVFTDWTMTFIVKPIRTVGSLRIFNRLQSPQELAGRRSVNGQRYLPLPSVERVQRPVKSF